MKISVLVPTLGIRENEIKRLLKSLERQLYKNFEVIFITQDNYESVGKILKQYEQLSIIQIRLKKRGLSVARNTGIKVATGEIIILSDDDCWYPADAFTNIINIFKINPCVKVVLTQILDQEHNILYKNYSTKINYIAHKLQLMSKSSIEIAFKINLIKYKQFDERLGLGAEFLCGEEIDFLLRNFEKRKYLYVPLVTVYHLKKENASNNRQIVAKGAIYRKNFNIIICFLVLIRDLLKKKENNFKFFFEGYHEYFKRKN